MPIQSELTHLKNDILEYTKRPKNGVGIQGILAHLKTKTPKRNLQRYLSDLVKEKAIYRIGKGPSTFYQASQLNPLPLSEASQKVKKFVEKDLESLHEGALERYQLSQSDFEKWQQMNKRSLI